MADPRAFISFDFDHDSVRKMLFSGQSKLSKTPFSIQDWSSKTVLPEKQWQTLISEKISRTNMLIVLAGKNTSSATGVVKEIKMAITLAVPVFGIYVGGSGTNTPLPLGLPRNRVIDWNWEEIASAINVVMKEGKNKQPL